LFGNASLSPRAAGSAAGPAAALLAFAKPADADLSASGGDELGSGDACAAPLRSRGAAQCGRTTPLAASAAAAGGGAPLACGAAAVAGCSSAAALAAGTSENGAALPPLLAALERRTSVDASVEVAPGVSVAALVGARPQRPELLAVPRPLASPRSPGSDAVLSLLKLAGAAAHSPNGLFPPSPTKAAAAHVEAHEEGREAKGAKSKSEGGESADGDTGAPISAF
jgi:hypothetical protein